MRDLHNDQIDGRDEREEYQLEYTAGLQEYCTTDHSQYYTHTDVLKYKMREVPD